ncbi:uncharacterized [Tachysurus ichikawai]
MLGELNRALHGLTYSLQINRKPQRRCEAEPGVFARVTTFLRLVGEMRECGELIAVHISEQEDVRQEGVSPTRVDTHFTYPRIEPELLKKLLKKIH